MKEVQTMCQSNNHKHNHNHNHNHDHSHSNKKQTYFLYGIGLVLYIALAFLDKGYFSLVLHVFVMILAGSHVVVEGFKDTYYTSKKLKKFTPNVHVLMSLAAFGSIFIDDYREGALLILIFAGAHFLEDYAEGRSTKEISNLLSLQPNVARLIKGDEIVEVAVETLTIGDRIQVLNGSQIPVDGNVLEGQSSVNQASITGESVPVEKTVGDNVFAATINGDGTLIVEVTKENKDTVFSKIIAMVSQTQSNVSKTAALIKRLEPIYVKTILILAPLFFVFGLYIMKWEMSVSFYRTMVFLIVSSPCALAATDIPATLSAISNLAKNGVLFKGGSYLSNLSDVKAVAFDKTGTITKGIPEVVSWVNLNEDDSDYQSIIYAMENQNNHPLANAITSYLGPQSPINVESNNEIGSGIHASYLDDKYFIGKVESLKSLNAQNLETIKGLQSQGQTVVGFMKNNDVKILIGILDTPKESAKKALSYLHESNIKSVMISGDAQNTASAVAKTIGIDHVYGDVMPEDKSSIITKLKEQYGVVAMLGDGVNDAPALVSADIGIAMGNGSDIAIDVADAVLVENDLSKFTYTMKVSKKLRKIVMQNIVFSMAVVIFLIIMNVIGQMDMTLAVLVHEGSTFVVLLNGLRLLKQIRE